MIRRASMLGIMVVTVSIAVFAVACGGGASGASETDGAGELSSLVVVRSKNLVFDTKTIRLPAHTDVTIRLVNDDPAVPHNIAIYTRADAREKVFIGELFNGVKTMDYKFKSPGPGTYYFRCDAHPEMAGSVIVK